MFPHGYGQTVNCSKGLPGFVLRNAIEVGWGLVMNRKKYVFWVIALCLYYIYNMYIIYTHLFVCMSICLSVYLSICLSV
jgi:hypothetical protein